MLYDSLGFFALGRSRKAWIPDDFRLAWDSDSPKIVLHDLAMPPNLEGRLPFI